MLHSHLSASLVVVVQQNPKNTRIIPKFQPNKVKYYSKFVSSAIIGTLYAAVQSK